MHTRSPEQLTESKRRACKSIAAANLFSVVQSGVGLVDPNLLGYRMSHRQKIDAIQAGYDMDRIPTILPVGVYESRLLSLQDHLQICRRALAASLRALKGAAMDREAAHQLFDAQHAAFAQSPREDGLPAEDMLVLALDRIKNPFHPKEMIGHAYGFYASHPGNLGNISDTNFLNMLVVTGAVHTITHEPRA